MMTVVLSILMGRVNRREHRRQMCDYSRRILYQANQLTMPGITWSVDDQAREIRAVQRDLEDMAGRMYHDHECWELDE